MTRWTLSSNYTASTAPWALDIELHPTRSLRNLACALAFRASGGTSNHAFATTCRAGVLPSDIQSQHRTLDRLPEWHCHLIFEVAPRLRSLRFARAAIEDRRKDIAEAAGSFLPSSTAGEIRKIKTAEIEWNILSRALRACAAWESAETSGAKARTTTPCVCLCRGRIDIVRVEAQLIVNLALLGIAKDIVRLRYLLEPLFGFLVSRVYIRMIFTRELAECLADLLCR